MTKDELIDYAEQNGVEVHYTWKKQEIEDAIAAAGIDLPADSSESGPETTLKVELLRGYFPSGGAENKLPAGTVTDLPMKEAKSLVRKGVATFPLEDDEGDE